MKEKLKDLVYNEGLSVLLDRMEVLQTKGELEKLMKPVIVSAKIIDMDAVISKIKEKWHTYFNIKDVEINLKDQIVTFKFWGGPYFVPKKYANYIIFGPDYWSPTETDHCDYECTTKEEYPEKDCIKLVEFEGHGIELKFT